MAITKIKPIKVRLDHVLNYASNKNKTYNKDYGKIDLKSLHDVLNYVEDDYKTEKQLYVSGINCDCENALEQMKITKQVYEKEDGILAFHLIQSFDKEENVTPEIAHKIGVELCNELFADRFECLVATHLNTNHYHNHIVINSVSFRDGKKYYDNHKTYSAIRRVSDNLCKEYGLNILPEKKTKKTNLNYENFYKKYASENNYKNTTKNDLDFAIGQAYSFEDFKSIMKEMEYEVIFRYGKISIKGKNYKRNIRIERAFGENYSIENIKKRILEEHSTRLPFISAYKIKGPRFFYKGEYVKSKTKPSGLENMFRHYGFLLKISPVKVKNNYLSAKVRADIKQMHVYTEEADFLFNNKITTKNELINYQEMIQKKLNELLGNREKLWKLRKYEKNENKKFDYSNQISVTNNEISKIRKELMMIQDIQTRIPKVMENIQEINNKKRGKRKEKNKNEYIK